MIKEIQVKSALNKIDNEWLPFNWDLNVYRGCSHKCKYCYALYSHKYLETDNFFDDIFVKTNIVEALEKKLSSAKWQKELINIGGVTDSYQPLEKEKGLMTELIKLFIKYKNPLGISTKSELILRDFDLLAELSTLAQVNIAVTVTTMDYELQKIIEPGADEPTRRMNVIREFSKTRATRGVHIMPIMPFINDSESALDEIYSTASYVRCNYVLTGILNLKGETRKYFMNFLKKAFPEYYMDYLAIYKGGFADREYSKKIYNLLSKIKIKYKFAKAAYVDKNLSAQIDKQLDFGF